MAPTPQNTYANDIRLTSPTIRSDYEHEALRLHQHDLISITQKHSSLEFSLAVPTSFQDIHILSLEFCCGECSEANIMWSSSAKVNGMFYTSAGFAQRRAVSGEANLSQHTSSEQLSPQSFTSTLNPPISYLATQEKLL
jgi:hypothetical protein